MRFTYLDIPNYHVSTPLMVWAVIVGPVIGVPAVAYIRLLAFVSPTQARGRWGLVAPLGAFAIVLPVGPPGVLA